MESKSARLVITYLSSTSHIVLAKGGEKRSRHIAPVEYENFGLHGEDLYDRIYTKPERE